MIELVTQNGVQARHAGLTIRDVQIEENSFAATYAAQEQSLQTIIGNWNDETPYVDMKEDVQSLMTGDLEQDGELLAGALNMVSTPSQLHAFVDGVVEGPSSPKDMLSSIIESKRDGPTALRNRLERLEKARDVLKATDYSGKTAEMKEAYKEAIDGLNQEIDRVKEMIQEKIEDSVLEKANSKNPVDPSATPIYAALATSQSPAI